MYFLGFVMKLRLKIYEMHFKKKFKCKFGLLHTTICEKSNTLVFIGNLNRIVDY